MNIENQNVTLPLRLNASRTKWLLILVASLAFCIVGYFMTVAGENKGRYVLLFFGLCALASIVCLLPNASYLLLEESGFTFCALFRKHTVPWNVVREFRVVDIVVKKMVGFNFVGGYDKSKIGRVLSKTFSEGHGDVEAALPDTYGMSVHALTDLMNRLRERYGR